MSAAAHIAW